MFKWHISLVPQIPGLAARSMAAKGAAGSLLHCGGGGLCHWNLRAVFGPVICRILVPDETVQIILFVPKPQFIKEDGGL